MKNMNDLLLGLELFYRSSNCYISIFNMKDNNIFWSCSNDFSAFFKEVFQRPYIKFGDKPKIFLINGLELIAVFKFSIFNEEFAVLLGPVFTTDPFNDSGLFGKTLYLVTEGDTQKIKDYLYKVKISDKQSFIDDLFLCYFMLTGNTMENEYNIEEKIIYKSINKDIEKRIFEMREEEEPDYFPFERQETVLSAITSGDVKRAKELCKTFLCFKPFKRCDDNLTSSKIRYMSAMLVIYRQAILFGVDETHSAAIYKEFCKKISYAKNELEMKNLFLSVVVEYTQKISDSNVYKVDIRKVNPAVKKAVSYISQHLHSYISVYDICCYCAVSESYLRINFKHDLGKSIVDFINEQKIRESKILLKNTDYTISEISGYLSFSSPSYFANLFKKYCGKTPREYRNSIDKC